MISEVIYCVSNAWPTREDCQVTLLPLRSVRPVLLGLRRTWLGGRRHQGRADAGLNHLGSAFSSASPQDVTKLRGCKPSDGKSKGMGTIAGYAETRLHAYTHVQNLESQQMDGVDAAYARSIRWPAQAEAGTRFDVCANGRHQW